MRFQSPYHSAITRSSNIPAPWDEQGLWPIREDYIGNAVFPDTSNPCMLCNAMQIQNQRKYNFTYTKHNTHHYLFILNLFALIF